MTSLSPSLSPDWTSQCVAIFCAEWVELPDAHHSTWPVLEYVPDILGKSSSIHLREAVNAASLAYMANCSSIQHFDQLGKRCYGNALMDLGAAMKDRSRSTRDDTLAAMNVLAAYEVISGEQPLSEVFHAHHRGQAAILRMRHEEHHESRWSKHLFAHTNRGLIWRDIADRHRPYLGMTDWAPSTYASLLAEASARLSVRAADVRGQTCDALKVPLRQRDEKWYQNLRKIAIAAVELEIDMQKSIDLVPKSWRPWSLPIHSPPTPPAVCLQLDPKDALQPQDNMAPFSNPSRIDLYLSQPIANLWNFVRLARLHLLRALLDLGKLNAEDPVLEPRLDSMPSLEHVLQVQCSDVEDICASVPFLLGDVDEAGSLCAGKEHKPRPSDALGLIWVLVKLCYVPGLHPAVRAWICDIFHRLGSAGGLKIGLRLSKVYTKPPTIQTS
ncbi:hypothetical protein MMC12_001652 [Toensbergia leucococca]|nr:hypothetical protein [Toensbergia leucococca]